MTTPGQNWQDHKAYSGKFMPARPQAGGAGGLGSIGNVSVPRRLSPLDYYFELVGWSHPFLDIRGANDLRLTGFGIFLVADRVLSFSFLCKVQFVFCHPTPPLAPATGYIKTLLRFRPHPHPSQRELLPHLNHNVISMLISLHLLFKANFPSNTNTAPTPRWRH